LNDPPGKPEDTQPAVESDKAPEPEVFNPMPASVRRSNRLFYWSFVVIGSTYILLIVLMLAADAAYITRQALREAEDKGDSWVSIVVHNPIVSALGDRKIRRSIWLSMISCTMSAVISLIVAVPIGYLLSRHEFRGKRLLDAVLDIPIVLPPLVVGLSLLILFQFPPFRWFARDIVYQVPAVILAQFSVACAFAVRTMKATFDHIDTRCEDVAITLGCTRAQSFGWVLLPAANRGMLTAFTLAWARSLGEFGPLLIFAGATRMKTEVLSTTVFLEMNVGDIEAAVAVSFIMITAAIVILILTRMLGGTEHAIGTR
jgi:molybdate transport system permease protein